MAKEPTPNQIAVKVLQEHREKMRAGFANIGEPAVEIDIGHIQTFQSENGELRAIIGMDKLVYLVERLLRP